jgi:protein-disulfide isomerase
MKKPRTLCTTTWNTKATAWLLTLIMGCSTASSAWAAAKIKSRFPKKKKTTKNKKRPKHPRLGHAKAAVTIALWGDLQCPFTKRLLKTLKGVLQTFPKKVKIQWHDYPLKFHRKAEPAAIAGREVFMQKGSKAFWKFVDNLFGAGYRYSEQDIITAAKQAGADEGKVTRALNTKKHLKIIQKSIAAGKKRSIRGTPTMFINGTMLRGAQRASKIIAAVKTALGKSP